MSKWLGSRPNNVKPCEMVFAVCFRQGRHCPREFWDVVHERYGNLLLRFDFVEKVLKMHREFG